jgi:hypothetical protein
MSTQSRWQNSDMRVARPVRAVLRVVIDSPLEMRQCPLYDHVNCEGPGTRSDTGALASL